MYYYHHQLCIINQHFLINLFQIVFEVLVDLFLALILLSVSISKFLFTQLTKENFLTIEFELILS